MKVNPDKIEAAVKRVLKQGKWPIHHHDKNEHGLEEAEYVQFVKEVLSFIKVTK